MGSCPSGTCATWWRRGRRCGSSTTATTHAVGGAGRRHAVRGRSRMVLRVDVVGRRAAGRLRRVARRPPHRRADRERAGRSTTASRPSSRASAALALLWRPLRGLRRAHRRAPGYGRDLDRALRALRGAASWQRWWSPTPSCASCRARSARRLGGGGIVSRRPSRGILSTPHYTRPATYRGWSVPEVLLSGHHERIREWRREQSRSRSESR
jgi:hypothetical protein